MEEFVRAEVNSYDAIIDASGNPIFEAGNVSPMSIMDIVNDNDNSIYYIIKDLPEDTRAAGRAVVKSFGVKSRFVHFEFFRMTENQASMGEKGQIVIPKEARTVFGIQPGDTLLVLGDETRGIVVTRPEVMRDVAAKIFDESDES